MPENQFFSPFIQKIKGLVPIAQTWRNAAERVIVSAERVFSSQNATTDERLAFSLVSRIFKISKKAQPIVERYSIDGNSLNPPGITKPEVTKIKKIFQDMNEFLSAIQSNKVGLYETQTPLPQGIDPNALAYAHIGSWLRRDLNNDGITFVSDRLKNVSNDFLVDIIIHESSHAVGIDHALINRKPAYGYAAFKLRTEDALDNASSYAWLAYQARKPKSQWFNFF